MDPTPLRSAFLFRLALQTAPPQIIGDGPLGDRRIVVVTGGTATGPRLEATVLPGGTDWLLSDALAMTRLDVRMVLRAADGQLIGLTYAGVRHGPPEVIAALGRGEAVDPTSYTMRAVMRFEVGRGPHEWLNRTIAIAYGRREPDGPIYDVHEIL